MDMKGKSRLQQTIAVPILPTTQSRGGEKCSQNTIPTLPTKWAKISPANWPYTRGWVWEPGGGRLRPCGYNTTHQQKSQKKARRTVRLHEASLSRGAGAVASPVMTCAECRQVHVYRQPVEEVNHSGFAHSAFEGKSLGVELACMLGLGDPRWRHWCLHRVILAVVGQTYIIRSSAQVGCTRRKRPKQNCMRRKGWFARER